MSTRKPIGTILSPWRVQSDDGGNFDEIVIGIPGWLHVEAMSSTTAWVRLGDRVFDVFRDRGKIVVRERPEGDR